MVDNEWLKEMSDVIITEAPPNSLVDLQEINIAGQTAMERLDSYLSQVKNPYCFKVGRTPVRISFSERGMPLGDVLIPYFSSLKMRQISNTAP